MLVKFLYVLGWAATSVYLVARRYRAAATGGGTPRPLSWDALFLYALFGSCWPGYLGLKALDRVSRWFAGVH